MWEKAPRLAVTLLAGWGLFMSFLVVCILFSEVPQLGPVLYYMIGTCPGTICVYAACCALAHFYFTPRVFNQRL
jgi:hypothetical protein